jgi:hypothetical protein
VVRSAYSSYRFCRRIDVGAVIQLTQDSMHPRPAIGSNKREVRTGTY